MDDYSERKPEVLRAMSGTKVGSKSPYCMPLVGPNSVIRLNFTFFALPYVQV